MRDKRLDILSDVSKMRRLRVHDLYVSRGGRPDLAWESLLQVRAPTLLVVGEMDPTVIELNQRAYAQLQTEKQLEIVTGATHLFEEPGALESVADLAREWFVRYLKGRCEL